MVARSTLGYPVSSLPVKLPILPIADSFARGINYLRVSVTDRCNFRCSYCMPAEGMVFRPRADLLTFEETDYLVRQFVAMGVRRVRLTGGEPTVRVNMVRLVEMLAQIPLANGAGNIEIVMTSNGTLLDKMARSLVVAGLRGVNVSVDTLDPDRFRRLTVRGDIAQVIAGIDAAVDAGLEVKLNAVALADTSADEIVELCEFAWERGAVPRFIEHMPMSDGSLFNPAQQFDAARIRRLLALRFGGSLEPLQTTGPLGPARYWRLAGTQRRVGIISAMSEHFCDSCNRLRLTATGQLHACLGYDDATNLRDIIRSGSPDEVVREAIGLAVSGKRWGHGFQLSGKGGPAKHMISMGG